MVSSQRAAGLTMDFRFEQLHASFELESAWKSPWKPVIVGCAGDSREEILSNDALQRLIISSPNEVAEGGEGETIGACEPFRTSSNEPFASSPRPGCCPYPRIILNSRQVAGPLGVAMRSWVGRGIAFLSSLQLHSLRRDISPPQRNLEAPEVGSVRIPGASLLPV